MVRKWSSVMERTMIGATHLLILWLCMLAEAKKPIDGKCTSSKILQMQLENLNYKDNMVMHVLCRYSMLDGVIDSRQVRAQRSSSTS